MTYSHDQYKDVKKSRELSYELSIERKTKRGKPCVVIISRLESQ